MFDTVSLDGVDIKDKDNYGIVFSFRDDETYYSVTARLDKLNINGYKIDSYYIALSADDDYNSTGKNNFGFVYGKLLACMKYLIDNYDASVLSFSGAEHGMNLVYRRFMTKYLNSKDNPKYKYYQYDDTNWVSEQLLRELPVELEEKAVAKIESFAQSDYYFDERYKTKKSREQRLSSKTIGKLFIDDINIVSIKVNEKNLGIQIYDSKENEIIPNDTLSIKSDYKQIDIDHISRMTSTAMLYKILSKILNICGQYSIFGDIYNGYYNKFKTVEAELNGTTYEPYVPSKSSTQRAEDL